MRSASSVRKISAIGDRRHEQRQGDAAEALPGGRPVDLRRVVEVLGYPLQAGEQEQRHERCRLPDVGEDHHRQRIAFLPEPDDVAAGQPQRAQRRVDEAEFRFEDRPPGDRGDHGQDRPGNEHHRPQQRPAAKRPVHDHRHAEADDELEADRDRGEQKRSFSSLPRTPRSRALRCSCRSPTNLERPGVMTLYSFSESQIA